MTIGRNVRFNSEKHRVAIAVNRGALLEIGDQAGINGVQIDVGRHVKIEDFVRIGFGTVIMDNSGHPVEEHAARPDGSREVILEYNAWICAKSIILPGSRIGRHSILGAGSVLSGKIPEKEVWYGNRAKYGGKLKITSPNWVRGDTSGLYA